MDIATVIITLALVYKYGFSFVLNIFVFFYLLKFIWFLYKICLRKRKDFISNYGDNSWVLVTGATDGIGKAICEDFARTGFNIILVSRNMSKLVDVAAKIKNSNSSINTHCIEYDFSIRNTLEDYQSVFGNLQDKFDISVLVNNVGTEQHNTFIQVRADYMLTTLNLNVVPQTLLIKLLFEKMNSRKNRSAIINLSSFAAEFPFPMKSLYSATKIFNHYLTTGLMEETRIKSNIDWLSVKPLEVETVLSTTKADGITVISAKQCAETLLNDLGYEEESYSHWTHKVQAFLIINFVPKSLLFAIFRRYWFRFFIKRDEKTD